jgi:integrase/recombinase XerD
LELWQELMELRGSASMEEPVFVSRKKAGHLHQPQINKIVKAAAKRVPGLPAEIAAHVSPHWLRHAHASHSLDNGAPIHLVQQTLGHASVATTGLYLHANPNDSVGLVFIVFENSLRSTVRILRAICASPAWGAFALQE